MQVVYLVALISAILAIAASAGYVLRRAMRPDR